MVIMVTNALAKVKERMPDLNLNVSVNFFLNEYFLTRASIKYNKLKKKKVFRILL